MTWLLLLALPSVFFLGLALGWAIRDRSAEIQLRRRLAPFDRLERWLRAHEFHLATISEVVGEGEIAVRLEADGFADTKVLAHEKGNNLPAALTASLDALGRPLL